MDIILHVYDFTILYNKTESFCIIMQSKVKLKIIIRSFFWLFEGQQIIGMD
jgi:hypothetical protein